MTEISTADREYVNSQLREAAILIGDAEHATPLRTGETTFQMALSAVRQYRQFFENASEREKGAVVLAELFGDLNNMRGRAEATDAVDKAQRFVADAYLRVESRDQKIARLRVKRDRARAAFVAADNSPDASDEEKSKLRIASYEADIELREAIHPIS